MNLIKLHFINQALQFKKIEHEGKLLIISSMIVSLAQGFIFVDFPIYLNNVGYSSILYRRNLNFY
jgi:hypothetical protein